MTNYPELIGDKWFNSAPLKKSDLLGKVVLFDFWTYSCVNCQRTLPQLIKWWAKYKDKGLLMIGIHTPEFDFEKDEKNVEMAIRDMGIGWPVVMDNEYVNWNNFANRYWPAKYVANREGKIIYTHFGEGGYSETEKVLQDLLKEGADMALPVIEEEEHAHGSVCFRPTPETYAGYSRGELDSEEYIKDESHLYNAPPQLGVDKIALSGRFIARPEYVESSEVGAKLLLRFKATEVNLVMHPVAESATVMVLLNNEPIAKDISGYSVDDNSTVTITKPTLYNFMKSKNLVEGVISIESTANNFRGYAFTFSGCEGGGS